MKCRVIKEGGKYKVQYFVGIWFFGIWITESIAMDGSFGDGYYHREFSSDEEARAWIQKYGKSWFPKRKKRKVVKYLI